MGSYIEEFQNGYSKESSIIVTIDGFAGAGKGTLAEQVSEILGLKHFSASDVFYQIAEERNLSDHELSEEAEKEVDLAVDRKTLERALNQSCVIDSRISSWVLGSYSDLRIRLEADLKERARRLAERENLSYTKAENIVRKRDREDSRRYKKYYNLDLNDKSIYNLLIDNTDLGIEEQRQIIRKTIQKQFPDEMR